MLMDTKKYAGAAWPVMFVLLSGIYGYWALQRELISARPSVPGTQEVPPPMPPVGVHSIHSRLWDDPLLGASEDWESFRDKNAAPVAASFSDSDNLTYLVQQAATSRPRKASDEGDCLIPGQAAQQKNARKDCATENDPFAQETKGMQTFFRSLVDEKKTICMPVLLPGGPYGEDKETRMRTRYAVVTALAESGYSTYSTRLMYAVVRIQVRVLRGWQERELVVPFTRYTGSTSDQPQVFVLWINESELELRPLLAIHRLLNVMFTDVTKPKNLQVSIIGPTNSGMLQEMSEDIGHINDASFVRMIHKANAFSDKSSQTRTSQLTEIENAYSQIRERACHIVCAVKGDDVVRLQLIRSKATIIQQARSSDDIRKLAGDIKGAVSESSDSNNVEIHEAAENIEGLVDTINRQTEELVRQTYQNRIRPAVSRINFPISNIADAAVIRTIQTEANILSETVDTVWQLSDDIDRNASKLKSLEENAIKERRETASKIRLSASQIEMAEASAVIQVQANRIVNQAFKVIQSEAQKILSEASRKFCDVEHSRHTDLEDTINQATSAIKKSTHFSDISNEITKLKTTFSDRCFRSDEDHKTMMDRLDFLERALKVAGADDPIEMATKDSDFQPDHGILELFNQDKNLCDLSAAVRTVVASFEVVQEMKAAVKMAQPGQPRKSPSNKEELITHSLQQRAGQIREIVAKTKIDGSGAIRRAADTVGRLALIIQSTADEIRTSESADKIRTPEFACEFRQSVVRSEPVTNIQRAVAIIRKQANDLEDTGDANEDALSKSVLQINQQVNRIRVALAYELTIDAANNIAEKSKSADSDETGKTIRSSVEEIKDASYELIRQLGGRIALQSDSCYWFAVPESDGKSATRLRGCMPFLSALEHEGSVVQLFSPRATMINLKFDENSCIKLHRVIGDDRQLAEALYEELRLRGIEGDQIALITEHDTSYGRKFPETFEDVCPMDISVQQDGRDIKIHDILERNECLQCHGPRNANRQTKLRLDRRSLALEVIQPHSWQGSRLVQRLHLKRNVDKDAKHAISEPDLNAIKKWIDDGAHYLRPGSRLKSFKVLQGIDGKLPGDRAEVQTSSNSQKSSPAEFPHVIGRLPEGRSQYDYLERLWQQIQQVGDVKAIGVVGSDVYDKLLVLRALKTHFPDCVFFTTDLDAIYSHSDHRQAARNLLIASHFDLSLNPQLQKSTAAFRDSYQTATFLATHLAMHFDDPKYRDESAAQEDWPHVIEHWFKDKSLADAQKTDSNIEDIQKADSNTDDHQLKPVVHVVGRDSSYRLNDFVSGIESTVHPSVSRSAGTWHYLFAAVFSLVAIGITWWLINRAQILESERLNDRTGEIIWIRKLLTRAETQISKTCDFLTETNTACGFVPWLNRLHRLIRNRGRALENRVTLGVIGLGGLGCCLVLYFVFRGHSGNEQSDFLSGYSTWPRKILYSICGIIAVFSVAGLLDQFNSRLKDVGTSESVPEAHTWKTAILTLVTVYAGAAFVHELTDPEFFVPALITLGVLGWEYQVRRGHNSQATHPVSFGTGDQQLPSDNLILGFNLTQSIGWALVIIIGVTVLAIVGWTMDSVHPHIGWHTASTSRGWTSRFGDWLASAYAFVTVASLFCTLMYVHFWFCEFARKTGKQNRITTSTASEDSTDVLSINPGEASLEDEDDADDREGKEVRDREFGDPKAPASRDWKKEYDRLWTIGRLSAVSDKKSPVLMGLLFVLVMAYHPFLSPTPMPLSLVVMTTALVIVFVVCVLSVRRHIQRERANALDDLRLELHKNEIDRNAIGDSSGENKTSQEADHMTRMSPVLKRARKVLDRNDSNTGRESKAEGSAHAVLELLELEKRLEETNKESSRQQEQHQERQKKELTGHIEKIEALSEGVFQPLNESPIGWFLGGGTALALVDLWIRWWAIGL